MILVPRWLFVWGDTNTGDSISPRQRLPWKNTGKSARQLAFVPVWPGQEGPGPGSGEEVLQQLLRQYLPLSIVNSTEIRLHEG